MYFLKSRSGVLSKVYTPESGVLDIEKNKGTLILKLAKVSLAWHFQIAKSRKVGQITLKVCLM